MGEPVQRQLPKSQGIVFCPVWDRPCARTAALVPHGSAHLLPMLPVRGGKLTSERGLSSGGAQWGPESFPGRAGLAFTLSVDISTCWVQARLCLPTAWHRGSFRDSPVLCVDIGLGSFMGSATTGWAWFGRG